LNYTFFRHGDPERQDDSQPADAPHRPGDTAAPTPPPSPYKSFRKLPRLTHVCGAIIIAFGLGTLILMLSEIEWNGLAWLFFYSIPANTAISVFPHEPAIVFCGQHFDAVIVALVAAAGNVAAGWVDYHFFTPLLQMQFSQGYKKTKIYNRAITWFNKAPFWAVVVFALTPLPFYLVKFLAFSSGYPMPRYIAGILLGRLPRFYLLALLGHFLRIPAWMMVALFSAIFAVYFFYIIRAWVRAKRSRTVSE